MANFYVRPSGAGSHTGADWNNAWDISEILWGSSAGVLSPGDTLWVAGGSYTGMFEIKGSGTAGNLIQIKRAKATDIECTGATGWNISFDSQVIFNPGAATFGINMESPSPTGPGRYLVVDGRENDGIRINLIQTPLSTGIYFHGIGDFQTVFRYIGIYGPSTNAITGLSFWTNEVRGINISGDGATYCQNVTFEHLTIAGLVTGIAVFGTDGMIYQDSEMHTIECIT